MTRLLALFDIDGTLVTSRGVGFGCMLEAIRDLYGVDCQAASVDYAGRLDPVILGELLSRSGIAAAATEVDRVRQRYAQRLAEAVQRDGTVLALPGVPALLDALEAARCVDLGLLTGNYEETAELKLRAAGVDPQRFAVRVFGDQSDRQPPARADLIEVAMRRWSAHAGGQVSPRHAVVVGDTPHDVHTARAGGCRSLAVATGRYDRRQLAACRPDRLVDDLRDTAEILRWMLTAG